jgi:hypothetical protein
MSASAAVGLVNRVEEEKAFRLGIQPVTKSEALRIACMRLIEGTGIKVLDTHSETAFSRSCIVRKML